MKDLKIYICCTFRDFNGSENDEIQRNFLKSLLSQTYKNFEMVVTLFGEKKVQTELNKYSFTTTFFNAKQDHKYRYSLSEVLLNALELSSNNNQEDYIVLWTTCDITYQSDFLEKIVCNHVSKFSMIGTSHPHLINGVGMDSFNIGSISKGFDLVFFSKAFIENPMVLKSLDDYRFFDWGIFEHFLISLGELVPNKRMINLYEDSKVYKYENDRSVTNESLQFLKKSHENNARTFQSFLQEFSITKKYFNLIFCHKKFRLTKKLFSHFLFFRADYIKYYFWVIKFYIKQFIKPKI